MPACVRELPVHFGADSACLFENPYRLVSLWDMLAPFLKQGWVNCDLLKTSTYAAAGIADDLQNNRMGSDFKDWRQDRQKYIISTLRCLSELFSQFNMPVSMDKIQGLLRDIERKRMLDGQHECSMLTMELQSLAKTIGTELSSHMFLYVPHSRQASCMEPLPPLAAAIDGHFDDALNDAIEASRCYGLGRNTACVFHCMRVLEIAIQALSKATGVADPRPNWDPVIRRVDSLLKMDSDHLKRNPSDRVPEIHDHRDFYAGCSAHFHAVKIAWRNRVMHVERSYGEQDALDIMNATRGLMEHLSVRLGAKAVP